MNGRKAAKMKVLYTLLATVFSSVIIFGTFSTIKENNMVMTRKFPILMNSNVSTISTDKTTSAIPTSWIGTRDQEKWRPLSLFPSSSKLANFPYFQFLINHDICGDDRVDLLILVGSRPTNVPMRNLLREKWGFGPRQDNYVVKMAFLFGKPDNEDVQMSLLNESKTYGDVVQGNFRDSYHNVTLRDLMGLRWTWRQCWQARFVMRTDDDISMDIARILDALEERKFPQDYVACYFTFSFAPVLRTGRYAISRDEYPRDIYDTYCQGWTYWLSTGAAKKLDMAALRVKPFWMNDAYISGTLVKYLGWKHITIPIRYTNAPGDLERMVELNNTKYVPLVHGPNEGDVQLAEKVQDYFQLCAQLNGYPRHRPPGFTQQRISFNGTNYRQNKILRAMGYTFQK